MKYLLGLMVLVPLLASAQVMDDFNDGNLHEGTVWLGDTHVFEVNSLEELWLNAPATSGTAFLSTPSEAIDTASWTFNLRLDFNPSASNYAEVFLASDRQLLSDSLNGYFVKIGGTSDEVSLWRKDGWQATEIIDGVDDLLDFSNVSLGVHVERDHQGNWQLWADTNGGFVTQGSAHDTTHVTSSFFGFQAVYTSTRSDRFFFDNVEVTGAAYQDTVPPKLIAIDPFASDSILLSFSEKLDPLSALDTSRYAVNLGVGTPETAHIYGPDSNMVVLGFHASLEIAAAYNLEITALKDLEGNLHNSTTSFVYYALRHPEFGDLIINEILADPTPTIGLPEVEFVEVFNRTANYVSLAGLQLADGTRTGIYSGTQALPPSGFAILCDTQFLDLFTPGSLVLGIAGMPTLNNSSDALVLSIDTVLLEEVDYSRDWYKDDSKDGGGFSLERINPFHPCSGKANWQASNAENGGTPGTINSVFDPSPDSLAPRVTSIGFESPDRLILQFNESLDTASLFPEAFRFIEDVNIKHLAYTSASLQCVIELEEAVTPGKPYTLEVKGLSDCLSNVSDTNLRVAIGIMASPYDLVFSEIRNQPLDNTRLPAFEYVEVFNRSDQVLTTNGMHLSDLSSAEDLPSHLIWPGSYAILCDDAHEEAFQKWGNVIPLGNLPSLNNASDHLKLQLYDTLIDEMNYHNHWFHTMRPANEGWSLERISTEDLCGTKRNWTSSSTWERGTPGIENSVAQTGSSYEAHLIDIFFSAPDEVELMFDARMDKTFMTMCEVNGVLQKPVFEAHSDRAHITLSDSLHSGSEIELVVEAQACDEQLMQHSATSYLPKPGDVVLNEVLFDPRGDGTDYIEVYNASRFPINLRGWSFPVLEDDSTWTPYAISDTQLIIPPDSYLAFHEDQANVLANYPFSQAETLHELSLPTYANDDGTVHFHNAWNQSFGILNYDASMHFSLIDDPDGVALELIHPSLENSDRASWHSASSTDNYGTPGYRNSQFNPLGAASSSVSLSNRTLSPDGDGFEDVVMVNYALGKPGSQLSLNVYTDNGVHIRTVASNQLVGIEGSLVWDGRTDEGSIGRTGIHILIAEVFHLDGKHERFKLPVVLASRR